MQDPQSPIQDRIYCLRHSLAHVLATAVLELRPDAQLAFGPPIEDGCYYDFLFQHPLTPEDFPEIEKRMRKVIARREKFVSAPRQADAALDFLKKIGQPFKVEYCQELITRGEKEIGFFVNGTFEDMCAGPHLEHTGEIPPDCFKIDSLAGAYWRGSEKNPQLTRIYCLAFENKQKLAEFLKNRELALARDHRKLGKELELFIISDEVGAGLPLWMPNGTAIRESLELLAKETETRHGYVRVSTPHIAKESLYLTSGHLPYYKDTMFPAMHLEGESDYYLKAMNCPHHHIIFGHRPRSYRELPLRFAEYGTCYRYEPSGSLSGLVRVRSLSMNDAHIYCTLDQLKSELSSTFRLVLSYYERFRFQKIRVRLSTHDEKNREKFVDNPELWAFSEKIVREVIEEVGVPYFVGPGEAAFYGPKIDFQAATVIGREETISTTQLDFAQPINFNLNYTAEDGALHRPYVVHRAPLSTHERFIAFLIEHFAGAFPTWLSPCQVKIVPVGEAFQDYAKELHAQLQQSLVRCEIDLSTNSFNKKIREAVTHKTPNIAIVGAREMEERTVTWRRYVQSEQGTTQQKTVQREEFVQRIQQLISKRVMDNFPDVDV